MRTHAKDGDCSVCGNRDATAGTPCMFPKLPSAGARMAEASRQRLYLTLAHAINLGSTEEGAAIRAHLITMGWREP